MIVHVGKRKKILFAFKHLPYTVKQPDRKSSKTDLFHKPKTYKQRV